ncbi:hypothetical protein TPA0909_14210 [Streptomyces albus]|nr:hypothetical protein TPA0909_14210 [Streptomyces albus]
MCNVRRGFPSHLLGIYERRPRSLDEAPTPRCRVPPAPPRGAAKPRLGPRLPAQRPLPEPTRTRAEDAEDAEDADDGEDPAGE